MDIISDSFSEILFIQSLDATAMVKDCLDQQLFHSTNSFTWKKSQILIRFDLNLSKISQLKGKAAFSPFVIICN